MENKSSKQGLNESKVSAVPKGFLFLIFSISWSEQKMSETRKTRVLAGNDFFFVGCEMKGETDYWSGAGEV